MKLLFDLGPVGVTKQALEANKNILTTLFSLVCEYANTRSSLSVTSRELRAFARKRGFSYATLTDERRKKCP